MLFHSFKSKNFPLNWDLEQDLGIAGIAISQTHILKVLERHFSSQGDNIRTLKVTTWHVPYIGVSFVCTWYIIHMYIHTINTYMYPDW